MKGWFCVPGIRPEGDRTIEEQLMGLAPALAQCSGKTVLDLGCAEGCISREFALSHAEDVLGIELLESHLEVARKVCRDVLQVRFVCANIEDYFIANTDQFDIVLCLGVIHKLKDPAVPLRFAARAARDLLLFRGPGREGLKTWKGIIRSKHSDLLCNVPEVLASEGFAMEQAIDGVRGEGVQYWRRIYQGGNT